MASSTREKIAAKIGDYYQRLTSGCGRSDCVNPNCASSRQFQHADRAVNNNALALLAVDLAKEDAQLCSVDSSGVSRQSSKRSVSPPIVLEDGGAAAAASPMEIVEDDAVVASSAIPHNGPSASYLLRSIQLQLEQDNSPPGRDEPDQPDFSEATLRRLSGQPDKQPLVTLLSAVFTCPEKTVSVFQHPQRREPGHRDFDEKHESEGSEKPGLDAALAGLDVHCVQTLTRLIPYDKSVMDPLCGSVNFLCRQLRLGLSNRPRPLHLCVVGVLFEFSVLFDPNNMETVVPSICMVTARLPIDHQAALVRFWCRHKSTEDLRMLLLVLMQLLTLRCLLMHENENEDEEDQGRGLNEDDVVCDVCRVLKLVFYAAGMLGEVDSPLVRAREREETARFLESLNVYYDQANLPERRRQGSYLWREDPLAMRLQFHPADVSRPVIPDDDFVNDTLNQLMKVHRDYQFFREAERLASASASDPDYSRQSNGDLLVFSFLHHPFLLTTLNKSEALYYDSRIRMNQERRGALIQSLMTQNDQNLYLRISVRRGSIVQDALLTLEMVGLESPADLKKQLMIEFEGEQGIDEGGLSKEFFQLIIEEIFNPDYGMFALNQSTHSFWFYPGSEDNEREFVLVGMLLGLAIYNSVILDIRFPSVLYKKLTGKLGCFRDLKGSHPELAHGLQELLAYDGDNLEDTFCYSFSVNYQDAFGSTVSHELKPDGANIPVTKDNRQEFVDLYSDFLLNIMIAKQFTAFCKGFHLVIDDSLLLQLFAPTEIELLVCGSKEYNFRDLESCTQYDSGYDSDTEVIVHFWSLVHSMSEAEKRLLLEFVTGSDRVPLGGMKKMKLVIARQGPDTDRLPTAHTCFNVLLLPEYGTYEKLKDRLLKAIANSKGFGML